MDKINGELIERKFAENPNAWLAKIKDDGVFALRLIYGPSENKDISDRMSVGFVGGGGRWLIETISSEGSDFWEARWEVGNKDHPEKLIWQVTYGRIATKQKTGLFRGRQISQAKEDLSKTLKEITVFAHKKNLDGFASAFEKGYTALHSETPFSDVYHNDISPKNFLSLEANQPLATSQTAWVFGGMGSWNDIGFDGTDQKEYERLSDELYQLLNESYIVAVNSSVSVHSETINNSSKPWWQFWK